MGIKEYVSHRQAVLREENAEEIREKEYRSSVKFRKSTQMTLPVEDIFNGCIILKDGSYTKILELYPTNFVLKPPDKQTEIIHKFAKLMRVAPDRIRMKSVARKASIDRYIETLKKEQAQEQVLKCRQRHADQMQLIKSISQTDSVSRRFFCILTLSAKEAPGSVGEAVSLLNQQAAELTEMFRWVGNPAVEVEPDQEDYALAEILYDLLNRRKSEEIPYRKRAAGILKKYCGSAQAPLTMPPYIPAAELVAPEYMDFTHPGYYVIDGKYYITGYIPSNGYPTVGLPGGWTSDLVNAGEGIDVDIYFERKPKEEVIAGIKRTITHSRIAMNSTQDTSDSYETASDAVSSGFYFKNGFRVGEDFYYMCILVTVCADSLEEARNIYQSMEKQMYQVDFRLKAANYHQEEAFFSTMPFGWLSRFFFEKGKQNMLTTDAASSYLFTSYSMCDSNGIFLGVNEINQSCTIVDNFNSELYRNGNIAILGSSGAGKTFTMQCMSLRFRLKQYQVFAIIPKKGVEFKPACDAVGGQYVIVSGASPHCINILEIRKPQDENMRLLYGDDIEQSLLSQKIQSVKTFFSLLIQDITLEERQRLDSALVKTYEKKGITRKNRSLLAENQKDFKEMPVLGDLYDMILEDAALERVAGILKPLVCGSASSFNGQTNVDVDSLYMVFDLDYLSADLLPAGMFLVLDLVWDKVKEDKTKRKVIILDELWALIGASANRVAADFVLNIFKLIRGYGGAAVCSTQDLNDFFAYEGGAYGKGIINACKFKFVMGLEEEEAKRVQQVLELDDSEIELVKSFQRGKGLICVNHSNIAVNFRSSDSEYELYSTDPKVLAQLAARRKRQKAMIV
ncbi:MAG: hypothetical protein LIO67_05610 [Lachnospiraceae bacterium]|nr:hypothetical protein [Lachnospiraceae bacterium]